jgi:hypothetical protein
MENIQSDERLALKRLAGHLRACAAETKLSWFSSRMVAAANDLDARAVGLEQSTARKCL